MSGSDCRPGLYRDWVGERYGLDRQAEALLDLLRALTPVPMAA